MASEGGSGPVVLLVEDEESIAEPFAGAAQRCGVGSIGDPHPRVRVRRLEGLAARRGARSARAARIPTCAPARPGPRAFLWAAHADSGQAHEGRAHGGGAHRRSVVLRNRTATYTDGGVSRAP